MPSQTQPFLSMGGTIVLSISTAPVVVPVSSGSGVTGLLLTNLSTLTLQILVAQSSLTTLSTLSSAAVQPGILLSPGPNKQITVSCSPTPFVCGMSTGTGLSGYIGVSPGMGMI